MNPERQQAVDYLRAPANGLWRWTENGAVVVWRDGSTVAFREEIIQVLEYLAPQGLPAFGSIVFLLAACREKVPTIESLVAPSKVPPPKDVDPQGVLALARTQLKGQLEEAVSRLQRVAQLPSELKSGLKARCVLAEAVFEAVPAERHVQAAAVLKGLQTPLSDADLYNPDPPSGYIRQIHVVSEGLKRHTAESLALRMRTGLDALPGEIDGDLPTAERARKLIEDLSRDEEMGALARAARELMAAVRLPRRLGERDELALGGVADITNRGPLDRLLLSELAHDDLTLAVRVALNEALYLRREPPMREPPGTLSLLLDSGVRLWGIPRVLSTSVALALVACDKQHSDVRAWRAHGKDLCYVNLLTRTGLVQHLGALEIEAHPGNAVAAFVQATAADARNQCVLITHRDTLEDPEFRRTLSADAVPGFVATVDRAGHFELHALPLAHRTPVSEAALNLDSILDATKGVPPHRSGAADADLPAIFGLPVFPFLLPVAGTAQGWARGQDGFTYVQLADHRVVRFQDTRSGARILATDVPPGRTMWMDCVNGVVHLVKSGSKKRPAKLVSIAEHAPVRTTDIADVVAVHTIHRCDDVILVIRWEDVRAYSLGDGRMLGRKTHSLQWVHGRYFRAEGQFQFVTWDGVEVRFVPFAPPGSFTESEIAFVFDREGYEGPWFVTREGVLCTADTAPQEPLTMPMQRHTIDLVKVSRDGHRIFWYISAARWTRLKDLKTRRITVIEPPAMNPVDLDTPPVLPTWNLYRALDIIAVHPEGLAFKGRSGHWRTLRWRAGKIRIGSMPESEVSQLGPQVAFAAEWRRTPQASLRAAELPGGTLVFLDSRGLLHFKAADTDVAEVSLVLADREVAGWTSDGVMCGNPYFLHGKTDSDPAGVFERLQEILKA